MNTIPHLKRICLLLFFPVVINVFSASAQNRAETLHELNTLLVNTVMIDFYPAGGQPNLFISEYRFL